MFYFKEKQKKKQSLIFLNNPRIYNKTLLSKKKIPLSIEWPLYINFFLRAFALFPG